MTNTREEIADTAIELMGYKKGYQAGSKYVAGLVEALKAIANENDCYDQPTANELCCISIAREALNNLPEEIRQ